MWLFNNPPRKLLKEKYGFEPTAEWLDHVQKVVRPLQQRRLRLVRLGRRPGDDQPPRRRRRPAEAQQQGARTTSRTASTPRRSAEEFKCGRPGAERPHGDRRRDRPGQGRRQAGHDRPSRRSRPAAASSPRSRRNRSKKTGLRSDVVTLYQGGQYHLYRFKQYTDVRLVFAPEQQIAFFGGDPDNFDYPRYDLDVCFFRVYENDKPAKIEHYLKWSKDGAKDDELVFVSGHPGPHRSAQHRGRLEYLRDIGYPVPAATAQSPGSAARRSTAAAATRTNARRRTCSSASPTAARPAIGGLAGLHDPAIMAKKKAEEKALRDAVAKNPELKDVADAWDTIAKRAEGPRRQHPQRYTLLEGGAGFNTQPVRHRPHAGPRRRGMRQAERGTAARVRRLGPGVARAAALLRSGRSTTTSRSPSSPTR